MHEISEKGCTYNVFIAVSYKPACIVEQSNGKGYRYLLEQIVDSFERLGLQVYLAPREEEWGRKRPSRDVGIRRDLSALREAPVFILFLDSNESDGALVELGIAIGIRRAIWILRRPSEALPSYLTGILQLELACEREFSSEMDITNIVREIAVHAAV
jgi:hypothetical protein